jgi:putative glutamine amidotransferase
MIPTFTPPEVWSEYLERVHGILLPGSASDIDPARYGRDRHPKLGKIIPERENLDFSMLEQAQKAKLPVLGICFGAQSLNVFRGGTLIQDIPSVIPAPVFHDDHDDPSQPARHVVRFCKDTLIGQLAAADALEVNSFHHQSVGELGANLQVAATAADGVIEAIEDPRARFLVGVQWHPERGFQDDPFAKALFTAFIREAENSRRDQ